jgi:hypothetical protein
MRDQNRAAIADCRVNGEPFEEGKQALRRYVETWPDAGFEWRKQYVILQTFSAPPPIPIPCPPAPGAFPPDNKGICALNKSAKICVNLRIKKNPRWL